VWPPLSLRRPRPRQRSGFRSGFTFAGGAALENRAPFRPLALVFLCLLPVSNRSLYPALTKLDVPVQLRFDTSSPSENAGQVVS
jgi:hypothetical protein